MKIQTQEISYPLLKEKHVRLYLKRIDLVHSFLSGNKWYKLKYNLEEAVKLKKNTILTFGGAFSNHIAATSYAARNKGLNSIGIIRGEERLPLNSTLDFAIKHGMVLHYISRSDYRLKNTTNFRQNIKDIFGEFYLIPEGGSNKLAVKGTREIINNSDDQDYICCSVGTGGTIKGIIQASTIKQQIIGFLAIKYYDQINSSINRCVEKQNWSLLNNYLFGGYARYNQDLINFIINFNKRNHIPLDAIYTGKMMFGIFDLIAKDYFPIGSKILAIHTGGLQGNKGMNERFDLSLPTN